MENPIPLEGGHSVLDVLSFCRGSPYSPPRGSCSRSQPCLLYTSRVIVRKPKVPVTESNYKVLQFLDLLKDVDVYSEVTGKPLQERLYQYMSDASLSLSEMEPYFSYYPDKLYKNLVETRVIYNGILAQ